MLFVWTTLFSFLFLLARALAMPWPDVAVISGFLVLIALAQWFFGEGHRARLASMIVGAVYFSTLVTPFFVLPLDRLSIATWLPNIALRLVLYVIGSPLFGAVFGYLAGTLVAGVFLVSFWIDRAYASWRKRGRLAATSSVDSRGR